jgi:hypothetical protein
MVGGKVNFNQSVDLDLNMYFESSKGIFQDKKVALITCRRCFPSRCILPREIKLLGKSTWKWLDCSITNWSP